jgi:hypothetical protein
MKAYQKEYGIPEFLDFYEIVAFGAEKHGAFNFLEPSGSKSSKKDMYASMFRHLAQASTGCTQDEDTDLHPLLHLIARAQMMYTRQKRGLLHHED